MWLTALVVIPLTTLTVLLPDFAVAVLVVLALGIAVSCVDLIRVQSILDGIAVTLPGIVRTSKGRDFTIEVRIRNEGRRCRDLGVGLAFDESLVAQNAILDLELPPERKFTKAEWRVKALRRGCYRFSTCYLEARSPMGLWNLRSPQRVSCEVRVYPNLHAERKSLAALFLHRGGLGIHAQRQIGKGRDFEQLREYVPGDDYGDIFWKASARRGVPITKTFQLERTQEVYVVLDHSRLSARELRVAAGDAGGGSAASEVVHGGSFEVTTQLERFVHGALVMGLVAEGQGDLFGLITFASRVDGFIRSRNGKAHYDTCRDALYTLETESSSPDFEELVVFVRKHLTRRALLVVLTDLSDPLIAEQFLESMQLVSRQHMVLVLTLKPEKAGPLFSAEAESIDDVYDGLAGHFTWTEMQGIHRTLGQQGVHLAIPDHEGLSVEMVTEYLNIKRRQLL